jgi:hypothetical protein
MGVRTDKRWDTCVGVGGGKPGSNAKARYSLAVGHPCEYRVSLEGEARCYVGRRRVAAGGETRSSGGDPHDRPPPEKTGTEGL